MEESLETSSQPMRNAVGTAAIVSRLFTVVGQPNAPACAGNGGFRRGAPGGPRRGGRRGEGGGAVGARSLRGGCRGGGGWGRTPGGVFPPRTGSYRGTPW